jgi:hypothetical protein
LVRGQRNEDPACRCREAIEEAAHYLGELTSLLPNLRAVVLVGKKAQSAKAMVRRLTTAFIFETDHLSPQVFNVWPEKRGKAQEVFIKVGRYAGRKLPATGL